MADPTQQLLDRIGGARRAMTLAVGVLAIGLIYGVSKWATAPEWVPVLNGLSIETVGTVTDKLDQAGIKYKLERGGTDVSVAAADLARARVTIARDGLPTSGRPGLELFDQPSWSMTDFTQRINYRRALEGELERTIGKMRGVEAAQVHLAMHETSSFRSSQTPIEASVVLKVAQQTPPREVVEGIRHLVASSVDGLESERVTIVDDSGRLLSSPNDPTSAAGLSSRQIGVQREVEGYLETRAEDLIGQIVGRGNARVQVAASVNFDRVERSTQTMDPEKQVTAQEQKAEIVPGTQGGAGSTNQATTYENSKTIETFSSAMGSLRRLSVAVLVNEKNTGTAEKPNYTPRSAAELARIDTLVRTAVGFDSARGDVVSVVSVPFTIPAPPAPEPEVKTTIVTKIREYEKPVLNVLALALAFVIAMLALKSLKTPASEAAAQSLAAGNASPTLAAAPAGAPGGELPRSVPERAIPASTQMRDRVAATVEEQPEVAAKLLRSWMKE
jgi:flagellar M-ring protein FliF